MSPLLRKRSAWVKRAFSAVSPLSDAQVGGAMVIDSSYTLENFEQLGNADALNSRELGGLFQRLWSVHPIGLLIGESREGVSYGPPEIRAVGSGHAFVSGSGGVSKLLSLWPRLNLALSQVALIVRLCLLARKAGVRIVRAGDPSYNGVIALLVSLASGARLVIRVSGDPDELRRRTGKSTYPRVFPFLFVERRVEQWVLRHADGVVAPTRHYMSWALEHGARPQGSQVLGFGPVLDRRFYDPNSRVEGLILGEHPANSDRPFVLCVSRLEAVKRVSDVVKICALVASLGVEADFWIVGEGSLREELESQMRAKRLQRVLHLPGNQNQDWLLKAYDSASAVLVLQGGRSLLEAALRAAPIVAYDDDWHAEFLTDGLTGHLVPADDWEAAAYSIVRTLHDPQSSREMGRRAQGVAALLDPESQKREERNFYLRLTGDRYTKD